MILHDAFTFVAIEQLIFQLQKIINNETKKKREKIRNTKYTYLYSLRDTNIFFKKD